MSNGKKANKEGHILLQIPELLFKREREVLDTWMKNQMDNITLRPELINKGDLEKQSKEFLAVFTKAIATGNVEDIEAPEYKPITKMLQDISRNRAVQGFSPSDRAVQGFSPSETATYIFSLQDAILQYMQTEYADQPEVINREVVIISKLIVKLGLVTFETYAKAREELISGQAEIMREMSIPVMSLWKNILMVPIVGTIDSKRAQLMMELVLKRILETESKALIIDILGVPSVDSAVANHLLKITKAVKLMGSECVISGMSPAVAQTMVHLGIELTGVITTSTLNDALGLSYKMLGFEVVTVKEAAKKR
jgi:rsbT co-antagonist protein RsbR